MYSNVLLLAFLIFAEAEGEPVEGKMYVAATAINMSVMRHTTLREEILRPHRYSGMHGKRIEKIVHSYNQGTLDDVHVWKTCLALASSMVQCYYVSLMTGLPMAPGVTHFGNWNKVKMPKCFKKLTFVKKIGNHWFYTGF